MKLTDTVALVTGAGKRIGRAVALELGRAGCHVVVHYGRSREAAEDTVRELADLGREAVALPADLTDPHAIDTLFEAIGARFGRLDVLVNSAASFERAPLESITPEDWDRVQAINLRAPFLCLRAALPLFRAAGDRAGSLGEPDVPAVAINFADLSGVTAWRGFAHHGVSKAGVLHLTRTSARELGPEVRVNTVVPGPILPPPGEDADSDAWRARGARIPLERTGDPRHVAAAVVFLAQNDFVTGASLFVDGGEHLLPGGRT